MTFSEEANPVLWPPAKTIGIIVHRVTVVAVSAHDAVALAIKRRVLFEQLLVLNRQRTALSGGQRVLVVAHRYAGGAR